MRNFNIEVEVRSFITKKEFERLFIFFGKNAKFLKEDYQETFYFNTKEDLRIQKNNLFSKIWMKKGKIHDKHREEIEIRFDRNDFHKLEKLFLFLGFKIEIKWFRKRHEFLWDDTTVCLDFTREYGYVIELEKMTNEEGKEREYGKLLEKLEFLDVKITSQKEFNKRFLDYKNNWKKKLHNFT